MITLAQLEELVRGGEFTKAAALLAEMNLKKIPRAQMSKYANLANRADQCRWAFRLLNPIIRTKLPLATPPSEQEQIEYAEALRRMGLIDEALEMLAELDPARNPLVNLRRAFCHFRKWQYDEAAPYLRAFIATTDENEYLSTIAKVNLAAALVHLRSDAEALELLQELERRTREKGQALLLGNTLELSAQVYIRQRDWTAADRVLLEAESIFAKENNKYSLYVFKWRAIAESLKSGNVHENLLHCRAEAQRTGQWETQRDCDLYIGVIRGDAELLQRVYFGTPHTSFRRHIEDLAGPAFRPPQHYLWSPADWGGVNQVFDLLSAKCGDAELEQGKMLHQLFILLCKDFYSPVSLGSAFSSLFPGEHFSQQGSTNRVSQLMRRLRMWFEEHDLQFSVGFSGGGYKLQAAPGLAVRVPLKAPEPSAHSLVWSNIAPNLRAVDFSRKEVERLANCSPATAKRLLHWAVQSGLVGTRGAGSQIKYRIAG